jgi:hypothetical protein
VFVRYVYVNVSMCVCVYVCVRAALLGRVPSTLPVRGICFDDVDIIIDFDLDWLLVLRRRSASSSSSSISSSSEQRAAVAHNFGDGIGKGKSDLGS